LDCQEILSTKQSYPRQKIIRSQGLTIQSETAVVRTTKDGDLLVVTIDHPPVNAISVDVRRGLMAAMDEAESDASVKGVLPRLHCRG
jgi:hypothetical protein